jgi:ATP-dependent DNA helicase PIF1
MELSDEQNEAYNKYIEGKNIFITGPGGSGKSELIRKIYRDAKEKSKNISVCALTGCAAVLLQCKAKTIHSWAGIGLGSGTIEANIKKVTDKEFKKKNWKETQILIIDEVSMLSLKLFEMLDKIGKKVRNIMKQVRNIKKQVGNKKH